jgi:hypothetical protein
MGRTKLKPLQNSAVSFISNQPNLFYWKKLDQLFPPSAGEGAETVENKNNVTSYILPQAKTDRSYTVEAMDSGKIIQSSRVVLLLEDDHTKEDSDRGIFIKCIICNHEEEYDDNRSTSDDILWASPNTHGSKIATVDGSLPLISYELDSTKKIFQKEEKDIELSIYCTNRTVTEFHLRDEDSLAVLLSLCMFLSHNNNNDFMSTEQKESYNAKCSIHNNLLNLSNTVIQPLLSAITQELLSVVVKVQLSSSPKSSSTPSYLNKDWQGTCYYSAPSIHVEVQLTTKALERCHPNLSLGLPSKSKKSTCVNIILIDALAILFPGTIISDLSSKTTVDSGNTSITAKMFYNSVDNANHNNYYWTSASNPTIPGLLPILRPYQEAAVRWMISREQINTNTLHYDEYWKVSWVVLLGGTVLPLHQYQLLSSYHANPIFLNPFTGCLCISINEAREATITNRVQGGILAESMGL